MFCLLFEILMCFLFCPFHFRVFFYLVFCLFSSANSPCAYLRLRSGPASYCLIYFSISFLFMLFYFSVQMYDSAFIFSLFSLLTSTQKTWIKKLNNQKLDHEVAALVRLPYYASQWPLEGSKFGSPVQLYLFHYWRLFQQCLISAQSIAH